MIHAPLPQAKEPVRLEAIVDLLGSVIIGKTAIYVSVPITSGQRFLQWFRERGHLLPQQSRQYREELQRSVIQPNCDEVAARIARLRSENSVIIIDPTAYNRPEWTQEDYRYFWGRVIERFAQTVLFLDGWNFSNGCSFEFLSATRSGVRLVAEDRTELHREDGIRLIGTAIEQMHRAKVSTLFLDRILHELQTDDARHSGKTVALHEETAVAQSIRAQRERRHFKDAVLDQLATVANVAQFVSFDREPSLTQRFSRIHGFVANHQFPSSEDAISALMARSPEGMVNVRSFRPDQPTGEPLLYGLTEVRAVVEALHSRAARSLYTIVNETIDVEDGGVSGVLLGNVLEFSPRATPQCVEKPGTCVLPVS